MHAITITDLSFKRKQRPIFEDLTLHIPKGQLIGLLGPNGTGKSTLMKCMVGIEQSTRGEILIGESPISSLKPKQLAQLICYMPQTTHLETNFTVKQVVRMGRYPHKKRFEPWHSQDTEAVEAALRVTGITQLAQRYVPSLSGGERQLVYLAKAIAQDTPILLLDEPTSDLDIHHQVIVTNILHELVAQGRTVIAAIHDLNLASRICDKCLFLKEGQVVDFNTSEKVFTEENLRHTFQVQSHIYEEQFTKKKQIIPYEEWST